MPRILPGDTAKKKKPAPNPKKYKASPTLTRKSVQASRQYLVKSSGTTKGEVKGVMQELKKGQISKGTAIKRLKGGPRAGMKASAANKRKVAKAIRKVR